MRFCTAINCMDGRVQIPVIQYLKDHFGAEYVDVVSEPGPNRILADGSDTSALESIERRLRMSVEHHHSVGVAVVGHHDCAGNPSPEAEQTHHTLAAVGRIRSMFGQLPVIALWVDQNWEVSEVQDEASASVSEGTS